MNELPPRPSAGAAFVMGLLSGAAMTLFAVALRFGLGAPTLAEVMADWLTRITPSAAFDFILAHLQFSAKPLLFAGVLGGQMVAAGGLGILYRRYVHLLPFTAAQAWQRGILLTGVLWAAMVTVVTPLFGGGLFGLGLPGNATTYVLAQLAMAASFGLSLAHLHLFALERHAPSFEGGRRSFLQRAAFFALLIGAGGFSLRTILRGSTALSPSRQFQTVGEMPPEVTPNGQFYEVSKNIVNPVVDGASWRLEVGGDVGKPYSLTYNELTSLPWKEEHITLTCISNDIGGSLISTALWRGVPLKLLLEKAGVAPGVQRLAFHAADGYVDSFPLDYALREQTIVAYLMNGDPLPHDHGFPARIIVPGLYGMEHVKWLTRIETVAPTFRGYWQERGWADTAVIKTMSRIDVPEDGGVAPPEETLVGGVAFAGDRGVRMVEVSTDGGRTWQPAEVRRALSPYTWVLWTTRWQPPREATYTLAVRATDGTGIVQTPYVTDSLPDGATGHHTIVVVIKAPRT